MKEDIITRSMPRSAASSLAAGLANGRSPDIDVFTPPPPVGPALIGFCGWGGLCSCLAVSTTGACYKSEKVCEICCQRWPELKK